MVYTFYFITLLIDWAKLNIFGLHKSDVYLMTAQQFFECMKAYIISPCNNEFLLTILLVFELLAYSSKCHFNGVRRQCTEF